MNSVPQSSRASLLDSRDEDVAPTDGPAPGHGAAIHCSAFRPKLLFCLMIAARTSLADALPGEVQVQLLFVGDLNSAAYLGAQQGLEEAQQQGEFLGQRYTLEAVDAGGIPSDTRATALIAALPPAALLELAARHAALPVLNPTSADDSLRAQCRDNLLHVMPSARMLADAVGQWHVEHPGAAVRAQAWHPAFEKYAAAQLNNRYTARFARPMNDEAWAGWAAVKLVSDMVAREQTAAAPVILAALRTKLAFDGQKGTDMSFRADGQLRQPLLLVAGDEIVGEAPVRGVVDIEDLDSLGPGVCAN